MKKKHKAPKINGCNTNRGISMLWGKEKRREQCGKVERRMLRLAAWHSLAFV
jgi:hypothetical protein